MYEWRQQTTPEPSLDMEFKRPATDALFLLFRLNLQWIYRDCKSSALFAKSCVQKNVGGSVKAAAMCVLLSVQDNPACTTHTAMFNF